MPIVHYSCLTLGRAWNLIENLSAFLKYRHMEYYADICIIFQRNEYSNSGMYSYGHFRSGSMVLFPARHRKSADLPGKWYWKTVVLYHVLFDYPGALWATCPDFEHRNNHLTRITDKHHTYRLEMNGINMRETEWYHLAVLRTVKNGIAVPQ